MLLLKKLAINLGFEGLDFVHELVVIFFSSHALTGELALQTDLLFSQLIERLLVFALSCTDFVLEIAQLEIHLSAGLGSGTSHGLACCSRKVSLVIVETRGSRHLLVILGSIPVICLELLRLRRTEVLVSAPLTFLCSSQFALFLHECLGVGCWLSTGELLLMSVRLARLGGHGHRVGVVIGIGLNCVVPVIAHPSALECGRRQFLVVRCVHFLAAGLVTIVIVLTVGIVVEALREVGQLVCQGPWCLVNV